MSSCSYRLLRGAVFMQVLQCRGILRRWEMNYIEVFYLCLINKIHHQFYWALCNKCLCKVGFSANYCLASLQVIAKGEAQGMISKFLGIMLGIALANYIGSSVPLAMASFVAVSGIHMYCNFKSYQSIQLRTLNPYRASNFYHHCSLCINLWSTFILSL